VLLGFRLRELARRISALPRGRRHLPIRVNAPNVFLAARERFAAEAAPLVTLELVAETLGFDPTTLTKWKSRGYLDYDAPRTATKPFLASAPLMCAGSSP
jgi:hypothetical protein